MTVTVCGLKGRQLTGQKKETPPHVILSLRLQAASEQ